MDQRLTLRHGFKPPGSYFLDGLTLRDASGLFCENRVISIQNPVNGKVIIDDEQR